MQRFGVADDEMSIRGENVYSLNIGSFFRSTIAPFV